MSKQSAGAAYLGAASGMAINMYVDHAGANISGKKNKVTYEYAAILELLTSKGANINAVDKSGVPLEAHGI